MTKGTPHDRWKRTLEEAWRPVFLEHPPIRIQNSGLIAPESKKTKSKRKPAAATIKTPKPVHKFKDPGPPLE